MIKETKWDYLFFSYKANFPLDKDYRSDLDKLHKAVNVVVDSELKDCRKQGALEELKKDLKIMNKDYKNLTKSTIKDYSIFIEGKLDYINTLILEKKKRIKELEEGVEK